MGVKAKLAIGLLLSLIPPVVFVLESSLFPVAVVTLGIVAVAGQLFLLTRFIPR
jgi:hypothetical protein